MGYHPSGKRRLSILVSGMIAGIPHQGGATWAVLQYLLGFQRLGHKVYFVEPMDAAKLVPNGSPLEASENAAYFRQVMAEFGLVENAALWVKGTRQTVGIPYERIREVARRADLLVNLSGMLAEPELTESIPLRLYLDLDPGFNQVWHASQGIDMHFSGHTHFATVGLAVGQSACAVPTCGRDWITTLQPIVLEEWPVAAQITYDGLTTIANWRSYGSIEYNGAYYGQKAHSLRRFFDLPRSTDQRFWLALAIHPAETQDLVALAANKWTLLDPIPLTGSPDAYRRFIQQSKAEFGIAKSGYLVSQCGWFSDRSVCYLASGRPVLAQETGFHRFLPVGEGLLSFRTKEEALAGIESLTRDYERHSRAARSLALEYFDSDRVLPRLLDRIGARYS